MREAAFFTEMRDGAGSFPTVDYHNVTVELACGALQSVP